ncbi:hypothetical protein Dsin_012508 [Dipteronia sinensis]|uniref:Uncharacterized protein n=1 Tax=Dipteronia sinensis TaxID=43782 RepID=A0AAE0AIP9_9ROSI|nr:hypothetical protein Dsin_012508 [Dipteronia sinensis]
MRLTILPAYELRTGPNFYAADLFLLRYFLPVILFYIMFTRATRTWATLAKATKATWAKAAFNLLLYIHGGHVFGGLWYSSAIAKEIDCWKKACKHYASECPHDHDFFCNRNSRDYKFINEFCLTKTRNRTAYDFGIYHDALESGIVQMRNFPRKVLHCFPWGLQNLSGFGQNIQASTDAWENIFVISITIYGMVLFIFFIGNMQIYLQLQTNRTEMIRQKKQEIEQSKSFKKLPKDLQKQIKKCRLKKWKETEGGVEFGNLFSNLPDNLRRNIQRQLCLELLEKVSSLISPINIELHPINLRGGPYYTTDFHLLLVPNISVSYNPIFNKIDNDLTRTHKRFKFGVKDIFTSPLPNKPHSHSKKNVGRKFPHYQRAAPQILGHPVTPLHTERLCFCASLAYVLPNFHRGRTPSENMIKILTTHLTSRTSCIPGKASSGSMLISENLTMSHFVNLDEGKSGQLPRGHRNGKNTEVLGHIQRGTPNNSGVEVQGSSSSRESITRPFYDNIINAGKATLLHGKKILSKVWPSVNIFPLLWCANKISIDPFYFYNVVINYDKKCVEWENTFPTVDRYFNPICIFIICGSLVSLVRVGLLKKRLERTICFLLLLIDLGGSYFAYVSPWLIRLESAIWPIFGLHTGPNFYAANLFLLQYFLTVILLYIMFTRATRTWATLAKATWAKAAFNLLLYIHGGHVFGALWYAFAIAKEIDCWNKACKHYASECPRDHDFFCNRNSRDYKFINEFCPTKTRNTSAYDFGIYHDALESGIVEMRNFPRRVLHCFRWGLQNLSGFGQNIQTSTDAWENIFVISITIYGMVLFVFFIGNMQIYLQLQTNRLEMIRQKKQKIEQSKSFKKLPKDLQKQIKKCWLKKWKETEGGVEFGNLFSNLPDNLRRNIQRQLCLELLEKMETWNFFFGFYEDEEKMVW